MTAPLAWRRRKLCLAALAAAGLAACATSPRPAPSPAAPAPPARPARWALALGGGAARGFAHIGVIQVLDAAGLQPDWVVGTSAGSVVGALYAAGFDGAALQQVAAGMEEAAFADWQLPFFKPGLLRGEALQRFVAARVQSRPLQQLQRPLGVVATDVQSGQGVLFQRGDTALAVRASSAIPGVFEPVHIAGRDYVDGGLVAPVPVEQARQMGAERVLAVDISSPLASGPANDVFSLLLRTFSIMGQRINDLALRQADLVIRPDTTGLSSTSFESRNQAIAAGRAAMQAQLPAWRALLQAP